jgi:hypothetical protein
MRVLVACEFSGCVRDAFLTHGHDAISCDILPSEQPGPHYQGDVRVILQEDWDMLIAFPPCTYLCCSGARWWTQRQPEQQAALAFVQMLLDAPIPRIALENPQGKISTAIRRPDQWVEPWMFGHAETKRTGLWLKGLPLLQPTRLTFDWRAERVWRMPDRKSRSKDRSRTFPGVAAAMAAQWG